MEREGLVDLPFFLYPLPSMTLSGENLSTPADGMEDVQDFYERYPYPRPVKSLEN